MMNPNRATSTLLGIGWIAASSSCSSSFSDNGGPGSSEAAISGGVSSTSLAGDPFQTPLPIPPVLAATSRDASTDYYEIAIRKGLTQMRAGALTPIVGFNGIAPGPTIVATRGRTVQVTQSNDWIENLSIHNHGHKVAASSDGHPTDYIAPGHSKVYTYPNDQNAGTYWYHDHTMDLTGPHVYRGLAAFYIIKDPAEDALRLPAGAYDIPLLIQDKSFNSDNSLAYEPNVLLGLLGDTAVVNGAATPYLDVGTRKYRFRLLNGSNARPLAVQLRINGSSTAKAFQVIASDAGLLQAPVELTTLLIAPAERYDIVVDFSQFPVGTQLDFININPGFAGAGWGGPNGAGWGGPNGAGWGGPSGAGWGGPNDAGWGGPNGAGWGGANDAGWGGASGGDWADAEGADWEGVGVVPALTELLQFVVARSESDPSVVPTRLANVQRFEPGDALGTKAIVFRLDGADWTINDLMYDPARVDVRSQLDQVYIWSLTNESPIPHPFHKHLSPFNILDINGQAPPSFMNGWKDTVMVPPGSTVRIIFKEQTFSGTYVFHCHILEHEDHGMMLQEKVTEKGVEP